MKSVFTVIVDCGDGSQNIEWHKDMSDEKKCKLEELDRYQSGDGIQIKELKFPDDFDLDAFANLNYIYWWGPEEEKEEEDFDLD